MTIDQLISSLKQLGEIVGMNAEVRLADWNEQYRDPGEFSKVDWNKRYKCVVLGEDYVG